MASKGFVIGVCWMILGSLLPLSGFAFAPSSREFQKAEFTKIKIQPDVRREEVMGIDVKFDLRFLYSAGALKRASPGTGPFDYDLICELINPNGVPVSATHDAAAWEDPAGHVHTNYTIRLKEERIQYANRHFFLPYYALNQPEGPHNVSIRLALRDTKTHKILVEYQSNILEIHKPKVRLYRVRMKEVEVALKDIHGDNWDYYWLTETEGLPDLKWSIQRARDPVFESRRRKNLIRFEGGIRDNSGVFNLCEGDHFVIAIIDNDMTSASDTIGTVEIDPWSSSFQPGFQIFESEGLVKYLKFRVERYEPPHAEITNLKLEEAAKHRGVTGASISFDYEFDQNYKDQKFGFEFFQVKDSARKERFYPDRVLIEEGEAKLVRPGYLEFSGSNKGHVQFFIPHFYLLRDFRDQALDFGVHGVAQFEELEYPNRLKSLEFTAPIPFLHDIRTFETEVTPTFYKGSNGVLLKMRYQVPKLYYTESRDAEFVFRPSFKMGTVEIDNEVVEMLSPKEIEFKEGQIVIPKLERNGILTFFIPYSRITNYGILDFASRLDGWMQTEEAAFLLGRERFVSEMLVPKPEEITVYVSQAKAKKLFWIGEAPQLTWNLYLGAYLKKSSSIASGAKKAVWNQKEMVTFKGPLSDEVTIELIHSGTGEAARVLGTWTGPLEDLVERKGGTYKVKPYRLKKMFIEIAPFE